MLQAAEFWVDRREEIGLLCNAMRERRSLLVWGPADAGKTALIDHVVREVGASPASGVLRLSGCPIVQDALRDSVRQLFERGDPVVREKLACEDAVQANRWLRRQPSARLRSILFRAASQRPYWIVLDHVPPLSHSLARLLKEIMWRCDTPVYLVARGSSQAEIGYAWSLFWTDRYRLPLRALAESDARRLMEICIRRYGLAHLDLKDFREELLHCSGRLPGAIIKMCALASQPQYRYGSRIKTRLLYIDYQMSLLPGSRKAMTAH